MASSGCYLSPMSLSFGRLVPGTTTELGLQVTNTTTMPCVLTNLALAAGSDPAFTLPSSAPVTVGPGTSAAITVRAAPTTAAATLAGTLRFDLTPGGQTQVAVTASAGSACIVISPNDFAFGTVPKTCSSPTRTFVVQNVCAAPATVVGTSLLGSPDFQAVNFVGVAPNTVIAPSSQATFSLGYRPADVGPDTGSVAIKISQSAVQTDYVLPLSGRADLTGANTDTFVFAATLKADVLLVIDNSGSMADKQQQLGANFQAFTQYATAAAVDYQLAVTTTDFGAGLGKILGNAQNEKILTAATPNVQTKFTQKTNVGITGSTMEESLSVALSALTYPLITSDNAGLIRPDASLAIVAVSDADDQSPQPVSFYVNQLLGIKGRRQPFTFSAIGPYLAAPPSGCSYDTAGAATRSATAVALVGGTKEEICTSDWAQTLQNIGKTAFGFRRAFRLTAVPDLTAGKMITVRVDNVVVPPTMSSSTLWAYDATQNAVVFDPLAVPGPGKTLTVTYAAPCLP